jgi:hypothetical protein
VAQLRATRPRRAAGHVVLVTPWTHTPGPLAPAGFTTAVRRSPVDLIVVTLVPILIALAVLLAVGVAPFVAAFAVLVLLGALLLWGLWKAGANVLGLTGENVFRVTETSELFGRGGPDDPDLMLVPRERRLNGEPTRASTRASDGREAGATARS